MTSQVMALRRSGRLMVRVRTAPSARPGDRAGSAVGGGRRSRCVGHRTTLARADRPRSGPRPVPAGRAATVTPFPPPPSSPSASAAPTASPSRPPSGSGPWRARVHHRHRGRRRPGRPAAPGARHRGRRAADRGELARPSTTPTWWWSRTSAPSAQPRRRSAGGLGPGRSARHPPPPRPAVAAAAVPRAPAPRRPALESRDHQRVEPPSTGRTGHRRHHHLQHLRRASLPAGPGRRTPGTANADADCGGARHRGRPAARAPAHPGHPAEERGRRHRVATDLDAVYWLLGPAEDGFRTGAQCPGGRGSVPGRPGHPGSDGPAPTRPRRLSGL